MSRKTINIPLPQIEGVELRNAIVDLEKEVIIAEYGQKEEWLIEAKRGDFLTCLNDPSIVVIFNTAIPAFGKTEIFTIMYSLPMLINGKVARTPLGTKFPLSNFRHSTKEEKALMIKEMAKWGKKYNPEACRIENIEQDISEIAVDSKSAIDYLQESALLPDLYTTKKLTPKLKAFNQLMLLAEAWNMFDDFKPNWKDLWQEKHYPSFEFKNGKIEFAHVGFSRFISDTHISNFSFKTPERAEQFGKKFVHLFRIVLTN